MFDVVELLLYDSQEFHISAQAKYAVMSKLHCTAPSILCESHFRISIPWRKFAVS